MLEYAVSPSQTASVLTMAVEGPALTKWAQIGDVVRDAELNVLSFMVRHKTQSAFGKANREWVHVDHHAIVTSAYKIIMGQIKLSRNIAAQMVGEWDVDMVGIDALVQVAYFGDVVCD